MASPARLAPLLVGILGMACTTDTGPHDGGGGARNAAAAGTGSGRGGNGGGGAGAGGAGRGASGAGTTAGKGGAGGANAAGSAASGAPGTGGSAGRTATGGTGAGRPSAGAAGGGSGGAGGGEGGESGEGAAGETGSAGDAGSAGSSGPDTLPGFAVAVLGSSTAAGEGASSAARGWVSLLASALDASVTGDFSLRNLAVSGYTTTNLLPGSGSSGSIDDALEREPNLVVVALAGSNDLSNGISTNTFLARLATIRDTAVSAGVPIFFLSTAPKDLSNEEQQTLADWGAAIGEEFDSCWTPAEPSYTPCFADVFSALADASLGIAAEYGAGDGIHLNDAGHARIFEVTEPMVHDYVCSMTACR